MQPLGEQMAGPFSSGHPYRTYGAKDTCQTSYIVCREIAPFRGFREICFEMSLYRFTYLAVELG